MGLPSQQPRGGLAPLSTPLLFRAGGVRTNIIQLRKQKKTKKHDLYYRMWLYTNIVRGARENQIQRPGTTFSKLQRQLSRCLEHTKNAVASPHCRESTYESIAGWCISGPKVCLNLWQNDAVSYKKNTQVEVLPVVDLCKKSATLHFFLWAVQHSVTPSVSVSHEHSECIIGCTKPPKALKPELATLLPSKPTTLDEQQICQGTALLPLD